ncbi:MULTISPECIES: hypothetical protein [Chryseobacterium]|uniref:hypothetical protein n=1 Tax=Chryseobacterium sp. R2A-55 TaxID=2744445 RepID=UPI001F3A7D46|nr:hypothetical protein [Chryseobacterium sp. R2A-55]
MEIIKIFVENFLQAEATASEAFVKPNLEDYNQKLEQMNSFCVTELQNNFGMIPLTELWDADLYEEWQDAPAINPRDIYKISHYADEKYGDVYVVYTSLSNPDGIIFLYGECLFIANINNEFKIIKRYVFGDETLKKRNFENGLGLADISFKTLQNPIAIERYMPPTHDKDGMEHYEKDI